MWMAKNDFGWGVGREWGEVAFRWAIAWWDSGVLPETSFKPTEPALTAKVARTGFCQFWRGWPWCDGIRGGISPDQDRPPNNRSSGTDWLMVQAVENGVD